ncbi:hypothetical protein Tco_0359726 [Tanacetum coccineum]
MTSPIPSPTFSMPSPSQTFSFPSTSEPVFSVSTSEPAFESPNSQTSPNTHSHQQFQQYHTTTVSNNNAKFPYLKKDEYETWAMKMEYWIMNSDHNLWNIENIAIQRETKARTILLQSLPEDHMADFHHLENRRFAMSSNNASSIVTYTSVSSDSNEPSSWGIPLENAGEIPDVDPYEEVAQQGQAHPLSLAYVPDPMEFDDHVPLYAPKPEHPEHHVPSYDDSQAKDQPYVEDVSPTAESPGYIADSDPMVDDTDTDSID